MADDKIGRLTWLLFLAGLLLAGQLGGCGQKGPLYLPSPPKEQPQARR